MMKSIICIALLFGVLALAHAGPPRGGGDGDRRPGGDGDRRPGGHGGHGGDGFSDICSNSSIAAQFPATVQTVINTLQSNGSFSAVLASRANEVAYINDTTNTALISTNCTAYFSGLQAAKKADQAAQQAAQQYFTIAGDLLRQAIATLLGRSGGFDD